jgi:hypothetical protein
MNVHITRYLKIGLPVFVLCLIVGPAAGQSDADIRRENQRLKTQVADLQAELGAANTRIKELEAQVQQLTQALRQAQQGLQPAVPMPPERVTIDESVPDASPRALLNAMRTSYEEVAKDLDIGADDSRERIAYLRAAERWTAAANRKFRAPIEWVVQPIELRGQTQRGYVIRLIAVDPVTHVQLGAPFDVLVPRNRYRRLADEAERGELELLVLKGVLLPEAILNTTRHEAGPFDNPPLIGPYVQFGFQVEVQTMIPHRPEEDDTKESPPAKVDDKQP